MFITVRYLCVMKDEYLNSVYLQCVYQTLFTIMNSPSGSRSFRPWLQAALANYADKPTPLQIEGNSEPYIRAIVSSFNRENKTRFSVLKYGKKLVVGLRHDCQILIERPIQQQVQPKEMTGKDHIYEGIDKLRNEGLSRDQIQIYFNNLISNIYDLGF